MARGSRRNDASAAPSGTAERKGGRGFVRVLPALALLVGLLVGIGLLAYPTFSAWYNGQHATTVVAGYEEADSSLTEETRQQMLASAVSYNEALNQQTTSYVLNDEELATYESQLDVTGTGIMGYLSIRRIGVQLPIYHGTDDGVLQIGIGHLAGSSLPVGGASTHSVLMGHRGLPSSELLTDLDQLQIGDNFSLKVLGSELWYEVDQILIVLPDELSALEVVEGQDLCTLVTCTPYGINSHRLLVRGHRVDAPDLGTALTSDAVRISPRVIVLVAAAAAAVIGLVALIVYVLRTRKGAGV